MCDDGGGASNAYHHILAGTGPRDEMGIRQKNLTKAKLFLRNCCQADLTFHEDSFFSLQSIRTGHSPASRLLLFSVSQRGRVVLY